MKGLRIAMVGGVRTLSIWCKGCRSIHHVPIDGSGGWSWDAQKRELTPSVRHFYRSPHDVGAQVTTCHYFIREGGQIEYLGDCEHSLRGLHALDEAPPRDYGGRDTFGW